MRILVCGSIGYGGVEEIKDLIKILRDEGYDVVNQFEGYDYSHVRDFRGKNDLINDIVNHDLALVDESDVIVTILNGPSFGTAIEMHAAKQKHKPVILYAKDKVPSPWPIYLADELVSEISELLRTLDRVKSQSNEEN